MTKNRILIYILVTVIAMILLPTFTACGNKDDLGRDSVTFTDALGREVTVPKNPERVVSLLGSFADVWMLAGGKLCASAEDAWEDFGLELDDAVNIGGASLQRRH